MGSLLAVLVLRKTFNEGKWPLVLRGIDAQRKVAQFGLEDNAAKMLLLVALANGELVVAYITPLECCRIHWHLPFELVVFALETSLQTAHYLDLFAVKTQLRDGLLHCDAQIGLLYHVVHTII
jgi:hypothetical protein